MKAYLLSIGCDEYSSGTLRNLTGAENDAKSVYSCLVESEYSIYDDSKSKKLLSPSVIEVRKAIEEILLNNTTPDIFTFFFAGHGGISNGSYYLCLKDSNINRLSFSAFSLSELFRMIASSDVKHVNLIIDACNTGGLVNDLMAVIKPEIIGARGTFGVSILVAAASDELAQEFDNKGVFTDSLISYLDGRKRLSSEIEYIDLATIGRKLSDDFLDNDIEQTPSSWGINLYGPCIFAKNPFYDKELATGSHHISYIPSSSRLGILLREHKKDFFDILDRINTEDTSEKFLKTLETLLSTTDDIDDIIALITGIGYRFLGEIELSENLKKIEFINVLLSALLPYLGKEKADKEVLNLIKVYSSIGENSLKLLEDFLMRENALVYKDGSGFDPIANYYYLSLRISKILGLLSQLVMIVPEQLENVKRIIKLIFDKYSNHIVAMCDSQAPYLYIFFKTFLKVGEQNFIKNYLVSYLSNFIFHKGRVSEVYIKPENALKYLIQRYTGQNINNDLTENPGELGSVLLLAAYDYDLKDEVDVVLHLIDRCSFNIFIPEVVNEFSQIKIFKGSNLILSLGTDVWTVEDFHESCRQHIKSYLKTDVIVATSHEVICCMASSFIRPDRVPYMYE